MERVAERVTRFNAWIGRTVAWFTLAMVVNTVFIIVARDAFDFGRIWLALAFAVAVQLVAAVVARIVFKAFRNAALRIH